MSGTNSNPGWTQGVTPTAAQWNALWSGKVDALNGYATGLQLTSPTVLESLDLPQWTTTQRPGLPINGTFGYNTTLNTVEVFQAGYWQQIFTYTSAGLSAAMDAAFGNAPGSVLYRGASGWTALAPGIDGNVLQSNGSAAPTWVTPLEVATAAAIAAPTTLPSSSNMLWVNGGVLQIS